MAEDHAKDGGSTEVVEAESRAIDTAREPPVVARLVIEIRSDGTRTIARGAAEDTTLGEKVAIHAEGTTPMALALSLAKNLFSLPLIAASTMRAMLPGKRAKK